MLTRVCRLGYPIEYAAGKGRDKMYDGILAFVQASEEKIIRATVEKSANACIGLKLPITIGDIAFLVEDLYKGRSVISEVPTKLVLLRWRKPAASTLIKIGEGENEQKSSNVKLRDLVCMTKDEATRHQKEVLLGDKAVEDLYDEAVIREVEQRLKQAEAYEAYR